MLLITVSKRLYIVEQPLSSLLNSSHAFASTMTATSGMTVSFDHGSYESSAIEDLEQDELPAVKPLKVMGTPVYLPSLERRCSRSSESSAKRQKLSMREKSGKVTGKGEELKVSEHYCVAFGDHVAQQHLKWIHDSVGSSDVDLASL